MREAGDAILGTLRVAGLTGAFPPQTLQTLARSARFQQFSARRSVALDPSEVILIYSGELEISDEANGEVWTLSAGDSFGEYEWLAGGALSAFAAESAEIVALPRDDLNELLRSQPALWSHVARCVERRTERHGLRSALRCNPTLAALHADFRRDLGDTLEPVRLLSGEKLFGQGEPGDSLYLVVNGRLRVMAVSTDGAESSVAEIGQGETVGEMALMTGEPRSGSVWAVRDTHLGRLDSTGYVSLLRKHPEQMMRLFGGRVSQRLARANRGESQISSGIRTLAVVAAGPDVRLDEFCTQLQESLSLIAPSTLVSSQLVAHHFGDASLAHAAGWDGSFFGVTEWMSRLESECSCVIYQADSQLTPWTERCIRQSDEILVVADSQSDPRPGEVESELLDYLPPRTSQKRSLVLLHRAGATISGTADWTSRRRPARHYHVREGQTGDYDRLARFLTNRAVGLALGGGFARGLAHLGVFEALDELGIPIDAVGGASMGAIVGGLVNQGWSYERCIGEIREGCKDSFNDMTLPFVAFKRGGRFSQVIVNFFGDSRIEDLPLPYFCVSANLNRAEVACHTQGTIAKAVLASSRAPAIFPPIVYDGELHVDGGLINNVPVDLMKPFTNQGIVIGVDVSPPHELSDVIDYGFDVSGWDAMRSRFGIFGRKKNFLPSLPLVLMRTIEFGGVAFKAARHRFADVYLQPPLLGFKRTDWHHAERIVEVSRQHALEQIGEWHAATQLRKARVAAP